MSTEAYARTFRATFRSNFVSQLRYYTLTGWVLAVLLGSLFLLASAAVIVNFLTGGAAPERFVTLTGYPSYLAFAVLGLAANGLALSALDDGGSAVYDEESEGTWDLLALTPMNRFVWMFSKTMAGMTASFVDFFVVLLVGTVAFRLGLRLDALPVALAGLALTLVGLQGFGFVMAAVGLKWKQPHAVAIILSPIIVFVSGMLFPVEALPAWVRVVSEGFPLTHGLRILRDALLLGRSFAELAPVFGKLALTGGTLMVVGFTSFKAMERRALRAGGLGKY